MKWMLIIDRFTISAEMRISRWMQEDFRYLMNKSWLDAIKQQDITLSNFYQFLLCLILWLGCNELNLASVSN